MWCPNCGREIADNAAFCGYCGRKIQYEGNTDRNDEGRDFGQEAPAEDYTESGENNDPRGERADSGRYKRPVIIGIIAAVVLIAALVTSVLLFPGGSSPNEDSSLAYAEDPGDSEDTDSDGEQDSIYERDEDLVSDDAGSLMLLDLSEMELTAADSEEALEVLESLGGILNIDDAQEELILKNENSFSGSSYYRFQQVYEGLTVYGKAVVLAADEDGGVELLSGNLADMTGAVTEPVIDEEAAIEAALAYLKEAVNEDETGTDNSDSAEESAAEYSAELCYYPLEETDTPALSWAVEIGFDTVFVDAACGVVLGEVSSLTEVTDELNGQTGSVQVEVTYDGDGSYSMIDEERNITCYVNLEPDAAFDDDDFYGPSSRVETITYIDDPDQPSAVDALYNAEIIYDFYRELFNHISTDGSGSVEIRIFDSIYWLRTDDGGVKKEYNNAFSMGDGSSVSVIAICPTSFDTTFADDLDIIAHEYTHQVLNLTIGLIPNEGESGALHEGIADIMGEMIEGWSTGSCDWIMGADIGDGRSIRNLISPSGDSLTSYVDYTSDTEVHDGSTIVSHAAYLMWAGDSSVDGIEPINSVETMSELWYRTILLLNSDATFTDCRTACEASARQMYRLGLLTEQQVSAVVWAFDQVGVCSGITNVTAVTNASGDSLTVRIYDIDEALTDQYILTVSDSNGELVETVNGPSVGSSVELSLAQGVYSIVVTSTEADYTEEKTAVTVLSQYDIENVYTWTTTSELDIYTTFGTSLAGKVTDENGNALEGVQITVEPAQIGQTQAEQIAEETAAEGNVYSAGQILSLAQQTSTATTLATDASGNYSVKLPMGIYQLTFEQDGYKTTTVRQVVFSGDNAAETVEMEISSGAAIELTDYYDNMTLFLDAAGLQQSDSDGLNYASEFTEISFLPASDMDCYTVTNAADNISAYGVCVGDTIDSALESIADYGLMIAASVNQFSSNDLEIYLLDQVAAQDVVAVILYPDADNCVESWFVTNWPEGAVAAFYTPFLSSAEERGLSEFEVWQTAYINYIADDYFNEHSSVSNIECQLVYIDDDDIPELYISYFSYANGSQLVHFDGEDLVSLHMADFGLRYFERGNLFLDSGGHMDVYYDTVYTIQNGEFVVIAEGNYGAEDNAHVQTDENGEAIYEYYWNGAEVSKDKYRNELNAAFDLNAAVSPFGAYDSETGLHGGFCSIWDMADVILSISAG